MEVEGAGVGFGEYLVWGRWTRAVVEVVAVVVAVVLEIVGEGGSWITEEGEINMADLCARDRVALSSCEDTGGSWKDERATGWLSGDDDIGVAVRRSWTATGSGSGRRVNSSINARLSISSSIWSRSTSSCWMLREALLGGGWCGWAESPSYTKKQ
jgi:hypothetical protein